MVRILANGDIVPDDDPRAQPQRTSSTQPQGQRRQGGVEHEEYDQGAPQGQQVSVFSQLNDRLLAAGAPQFDIGAWGTVEPIVYVGFLLVFLLMGWNGILFGGLLFAVSRYSAMSGGGGGGGGGRGGGRSDRGGRRRGWATSGGHRLNR